MPTFFKNDLHALEQWEQDWSMEFNSDKCEVLRITCTVFEIALVRMSETSDYLPGQVNNPSAVIRWPSEKLQPSADFRSNAFEVDTNLGHDE